MTVWRRLVAVLLIVLVIAICAIALRSHRPRRLEDVPLAKELLDGPVPTAEHVKEPAAKLYALGFSEEADRLLNYPEVAAIGPLLGRAAPAPATIRDAIAMPETSDQELGQLRDRILDQRIVVTAVDATGRDLPDVKAALASFGSNPASPVHVQGALWRTTVDQGGAASPVWLISVSVVQQLGQPARLWMLVQGAQGDLLTCRTGVIAPNEPTDALCYAKGGAPAPKASLGMAWRVISISASDMQGHDIDHVSRNGGEAARQFRQGLAATSGSAVAYVSCQQRGDCLQTLATIVLSPSSLGFVLVAAGMIWAVRWRWRGQYEEGRTNPFKPAFSLYLVLVLLAIPIDVLDSRALQGGAPLFTGLISTAYHLLMAMPWMAFRMQQISHVSGAALVGGPEVDMVLSWIFMLANLAWLWCMAYPPASAGRSARM